MEHRDYNYYEANAATVNMGEITSSAVNVCTLHRLRDGDDNLNHLYLGVEGCIMEIAFREGDDLGWWGYFIGRSQCIQRLSIYYLPDGEEGHALLGGISRSQSIRDIGIHDVSNDTFTSIMRALHRLSQLEKLTIDGNNTVGPYGWSKLRTLLESGVCKLKELDLRGNNYIGNEGLDVLSNGLRGIGSSLKVLRLIDISIGNEGLLTVVQALQNCTSLDLETLQLSHNNFSSAAAGLSSLSDWLRRDEVNLQYLKLSYCRINDEGLHELFQGVANCEVLDLDGNETITSTGLSYLYSSIRSDRCRLETLDLRGIPVGDNEMEVLARGLTDNRSVRNLYLEDLGDDISVTSSGWIAFSRALCDTSSVNSTYLSNHNICDVWDEDDGETIPHQDIFKKYLRLNGEHPQYAARCKILMSHPHLDMGPLLHWGLKFLPLAVAWFERAKPCTTLTIYDEDPDLRRLVLDESDEAFESRELTAMFEFVRGMPMEVMKRRKELIVAAYDDNDEIARIDERYREALEQRDRKIEERDRKIEQLEEEIMRLRGL
eukprot:scaffold9129_cov78-Skeletonema_dohrnii-CCMP3373.AAC.2